MRTSGLNERLWAALAHASILLNLVTLILGTMSVLVLYLMTRRRSPYVAFHALQALAFQVIVWIGGGLVALGAWRLSTALPASFFSIFLLPTAFLLSLVPLVGALVAGTGALLQWNGQEFSYPRISEWARNVINR